MAIDVLKSFVLKTLGCIVFLKHLVSYHKHSWKCPEVSLKHLV